MYTLKKYIEITKNVNTEIVLLICGSVLLKKIRYQESIYVDGHVCKIEYYQEGIVLSAQTYLIESKVLFLIVQ